MIRDDPEVTGLVRRLRCALEGAGMEGIVSAYLFGSRAAGRGHRESDVDVGVLLHRAVHPDPAARFEAGCRLAARLQAAVAPRELDLVVLNDAPPLLARRIVREGRRVLCTDAEADRAFVRDVQLRAADLEPFIRRSRRILAETLNRR